MRASITPGIGLAVSNYNVRLPTPGYLDIWLFGYDAPGDAPTTIAIIVIMKMGATIMQQSA